VNTQRSALEELVEKEAALSESQWLVDHASI